MTTAEDITRHFNRERDALMLILKQVVQRDPEAIVVPDLIARFDRAYTLGIRFAMLTMDQAVEAGAFQQRRPRCPSVGAGMRCILPAGHEGAHTSSQERSWIGDDHG